MMCRIMHLQSVSVRYWVMFLLVAFPAVVTGKPRDRIEPTNQRTAIPLYEVDLESSESVRRLATLGVDLLEVGTGRRAQVLGWPGVREELEAAGLSFREV